MDSYLLSHGEIGVFRHVREAQFLGTVTSFSTSAFSSHFRLSYQTLLFDATMDKKRKRSNALQDGDGEAQALTVAKASKAFYDAVVAEPSDVDALKDLVQAWTSKKDGEVPGEVIDGYKGEDRKTALMIAVERGEIECLEILLKAGAFADSKDSDGYTAMMRAVLSDNTEALHLLVEYASLEARKGWDDDHPDTLPTCLLLASEFGETESCRILIEAGADLEATYLTDTSLIIAAREDELECLKLLIEKGANLEACQAQSFTALIVASKNGNLECVNALLDGGANKEATDGFGFTALIHSIREDEDEIAKCLIEAGANVNCTDKEGKSALKWAEEKDNDEVVDWLKQAGAK